jgi:hypothetical protein
MTDAEKRLLENLAELEHEQWMEWARAIDNSEVLSNERRYRWGKCMVPYGQLSETMKEHDRKWAYRVLEIVDPELERLRATIKALQHELCNANDAAGRWRLQCKVWEQKIVTTQIIFNSGFWIGMAKQCVRTG